jgi:signal recognition particle GTPase
MGLVNRIVSTITARMSKEDKQRLIEEMTEEFLADMTVEEKQEIVSNIMNKFLSDMTIEDKKKIMSEITPQMIEGFDMAVIMPQMMMAMMGQVLQKEGTASTMPMGVNITGKTKEPSESPSQQEKGVRNKKS